MVVDELLVVLGIDATKFNQGQREALDAFRRTKQGAEEFSKDVERQGTKLSEMFGIVRRGAMGIVGAFIGGEAVSFINQIAGMDAATGRYAKTINTTVQNLSQWQGMIRMIGGEAPAATAVLSTLQQQIESVRQGSGMFDGGFATLMNRAGVSLRDDADASLRKIRAHISTEMSSGRMTGSEAATWLRRVPGMNQDMVNLLSMTTAEFNALAEAARKAGTANKESAEAGSLLQQAFTGLILRVEDLVRGITPFVNLLTKPVGSLSGADVEKATGGGLSHLGGGLFEKGSLMDRLDRSIWGDTKWNTPGKGGTDDEKMAAYKAAIAAIESRGSGGYSAVGPATRTGDQALGKYQVMASNVPSWTKEALGRSMTAAQFLNDPDAQEAVFKHKFGQYVEKHGAAGAAAAWFAGEKGMNDPNRRDALGTSTGAYVDKFSRNLGAGAAAAGRVDNRRSSTSTSTSETSIGSITVVAPAANDADGVARELGPAIKRSSIAAPANVGLV